MLLVGARFVEKMIMIIFIFSRNPFILKELQLRGKDQAILYRPLLLSK